jgi:hypothetical protein
VTRDEAERMKVLCERIKVEKDPRKFSQLIVDLNVSLELKNKRLIIHLIEPEH